MGEYAIRKSDKSRIKIGTCESMYYLRLDDQAKVEPETGSGFGHYWRLPFPDEDRMLPGDYQDYNRSLRLYKPGKHGAVDYVNEAFSKEYPGTVQLHHKGLGLLVNLPCSHGQTLPEGVNAHWNGKGHSLELAWLRTTAEGVKPIIKCVHCENMWRESWDNIWDYIPPDMKDRLAKYRVKESA